ncbi:MAG: hypothetical protein ABSF70_02155 [Terracidiphilus sp.]
MGRSLITLLGIALFASYCCGETRWCSVVGRGPNDTLIYPPIARAARVYGVVLSRIYYLPTGEVKDVAAISGPVMLFRSMREQMMGWKIRTDASDDQLCQTLVVADFRLHFPSDPVQESPKAAEIPSILRLTIDGEAYMIIDPAAVIHWTPISRLKYALRRIKARVFPHSDSGPHCCKPIE